MIFIEKYLWHELGRSADVRHNHLDAGLLGLTESNNFRFSAAIRRHI
jgi:hypothetical protein